MFELLKHINFGVDLITWVKACYSNIYSTMINNVHTGGWFQINKGMTQGCPHSGTLIVLGAEKLVQQIFAYKNINGLHLGEFQVRLVQFVDDAFCG